MDTNDRSRGDRGPLTDSQVKALAPTDQSYEIRDTELGGLILRVLPSGVKQWNLRYRFHGKQRRLLLGQYPHVGLAAVRKKARKAQTTIDDGRDPAAERRAAAAKPTDTVASLVEDYLEQHARPNKRSAGEDERILNADVLPYWKDRSVRTLARRDVKDLIGRVVKRKAPIMANRLLAVVRRVLNHAVDEEWIDANPAARIKKPSPDVSRGRVLSEPEIQRFWRLVTNLPTTADKPAPGRKRSQGTDDDPICPLSAPLAAVQQVRLLTAQRGGEVVRMKWRDLDLASGWWTIPDTDTKNKQTHRVYLVDEVRAIIEAQQPEADRTPDGFVFAGLGAASVADRAKKAPALLAKALGFDFRGHDLRRTASTKMAEAGIPRAHISYVLNHVDGTPRATRIYDRYERDNEKKLALETWARVLRRILDNVATDNVVAFTRGA